MRASSFKKTIVNESLIIQKDNQLIGLVHPDTDEAKALGFSKEDLENIMEQNRKELNDKLPAFSKITAIILHEEEFAKTPKKSIKRYLYQNTI